MANEPSPEAVLEMLRYSAEAKQQDHDRFREQRRFQAACAAMTGMLASGAEWTDPNRNEKEVDQTYEDVAIVAVGNADALLAELEKRHET